MDKMIYIYIACGVLAIFLVILLIINSKSNRKKNSKKESVAEDNLSSSEFEVVSSTEYVMPKEETVTAPVVIPEIFNDPVIPEETTLKNGIPDIPAPLSSSDGPSGDPVFDPMYNNVGKNTKSDQTQYNSFNDIAAAFMSESTNKDQSN